MTLENLISQYSLADFVDIQNLRVTVSEIAGAVATHPPGVVEPPTPVNITRNQELKAKFEWEYINEFSLEPVKLFFQLYFEKMGTGTDVNFPATPGNKALGASVFTLTPDDYTIAVPPSTLDEGVYKMIAVVKLGLGAAPVGSLLAAFKEIGWLNVFEARPL